MTEAEWLACTDPEPMLEFLRGKASKRKLRLFACACCRRVWLRWGEPTAPEQVEISERFADGEVSGKRLREIRSQLGARGGVSAAWAANCSQFAVLEGQADNAANQAVTSALAFAYHLGYEETFSRVTYTGDSDRAVAAQESERKELATVVLEIFGNPFRPITLSPSGFTPTVRSLTQAIYAEKAFDRMPVLAEALEEAGCKNPDILDHCRGAGRHVRGCWVVDYLLGEG